MSHKTSAMMRNFVALPFASDVGENDLVPAEELSPLTLVTFFDVPLSGISVPPFFIFTRPRKQ
jgi:hypothetical protein